MGDHYQNDEVEVPAQCEATPIEIREGTLDDIPSLVGLLAELFFIEADFEPDSKKQETGLRLLLNSPKDCILVATYDNQVCTKNHCTLLCLGQGRHLESLLCLSTCVSCRTAREGQ